MHRLVPLFVTPLFQHSVLGVLRDHRRLFLVFRVLGAALPESDFVFGVLVFFESFGQRQLYYVLSLLLRLLLRRLRLRVDLLFGGGLLFFWLLLPTFLLHLWLFVCIFRDLLFVWVETQAFVMDQSADELFVQFDTLSHST